jgi:DNA-directed RNA polymerase specialized sigma24 family protein
VTARRRRYLAGFIRAKRPKTITTYLGGLDNTRDEILPRYHRDANADDPWLAPTRSEAVRALLVLIAAAQAHTAVDEPVEASWDLRGFCEDAELEAPETDVLVLVGEGWSQRRIAEWLGFSQATVCRRLSTGRHKLVGYLPLEVAYRLQTA